MGSPPCRRCNGRRDKPCPTLRGLSSAGRGILRGPETTTTAETRKPAPLEVPPTAMAARPGDLARRPRHPPERRLDRERRLRRTRGRLPLAFAGPKRQYPLAA